jgi:hypothetical protein
MRIGVACSRETKPSVGMFFSPSRIPTPLRGEGIPPEVRKLLVDICLIGKVRWIGPLPSVRAFFINASECIE